MPGVSVKDLWENADPRKQQAQAQSGPTPHPADDDYAPPVSTVRLPSRGLVYPPENPLYLAETIDIKAVTAKEENILSSPVLIKKGTVLSTLMRACITNRTVDPDSMLVGDRNAVLVAIRVSAYGPKYQARISCPSCGETADHDFDLSRLGLKSLDVDPCGGPGSNEFEFTLPISCRRVKFRMLDANGITRLDKDTEAVKKKTGQEQNVTLRLIAQVTELQGVADPKNLPNALGNLSAQDSRALRLYMDKIAPGVDMEQEYECASCGITSEVEIPIGTEFFWPSGG
jgi:hypothetical protein